MTSEAVATASGPQKLSPETFVLRSDPPAISRFRKEIMIGIAASAAIAVAAATWIALSPERYHASAPKLDENASAQANVQEVIATAPSDYSEVPQLGPRLPGDLGGPILRYQESQGFRDTSLASDPIADAALQAREAEEQRLRNLELSARASGLIISKSDVARAESRIEARGPVWPSEGARQVGDSGSTKSETNDTASAHTRSEPASPWTLQAGSIIAASLITGLNSDLPGLVTAQVSENVYDSVSGENLLIPQGARLIGNYNSSIAFGQSRILLVWQRILFPDGTSIQIDNLPASDAQGYVGLHDQTDPHSFEVLKGVGLSTLMGIGPELALGSSDSDLVRALRNALQDSGTRASDQLVQRSMSVKPTLKVRPGWPLRIVVHKDIDLEPSPRKEKING